MLYVIEFEKCFDKIIIIVGYGISNIVNKGISIVKIKIKNCFFVWFKWVMKVMIIVWEKLLMFVKRDM